MEDTLYEVKARVISVLANPKRLEILDRLAEREWPVTELSLALGLAQSTTSQHLAIMRNAGIVRSRKERNHVYYRLADPQFATACGVMGQAVVRLVVSLQEDLLPVVLGSRRGGAPS